MKKLATLLLSTVLVGGLTASAFAASTGTVTNAAYGQRGNFAAQQMQGPRGQMQNFNGQQGQNLRGQQGQFANAQRPGVQGQGMRGPQGRPGFGGSDILRLACSVNGAPRLEIALNNLSERLTLDADQTTLFDAFKTSALTAQTGYADSCQLPTVAANTPVNPVERLKAVTVNATARVAAIDAVLPSLEAFYNSLSDTQKAALAANPRGAMQMGQGQSGTFRPGMNGRGMAPGAFAPNQDNSDNTLGYGYGRGNGINQKGQGVAPGQGVNQAPGLGMGRGMGPRASN